MVADFKDRADAGQQLAAAVVRLGLVDPLVLALPRGGVPVAAEVAHALHAPLDLLIVRKIGAPGQPELAVEFPARCGTRRMIGDVLRENAAMRELAHSQGLEVNAAASDADALRFVLTLPDRLDATPATATAPS